MAGRIGAISSAAKAVETRWNAVLRLISGWEDAAIATPREPLPDGEILPWCDLDHLRGCEPEIVIEANDKRTSHAIERDLGFALPHAGLIDATDRLTAAAGAWRGRWVVKDPWGVAGRERLLGEGEPTANQLKWCQGRLSQGVELIFEPWVEQAREWSLHFDATDSVTYVGACDLLTYGEGTFRGVVPNADPPKSLMDGARAAAEAIYDLGYRGPIGIDAMIGRLDGAPVERPITEINARYSFGRLALELARRTDVERFEWRHDRCDDERLEWKALSSGAPCRLPDFCDPNGASGSWCRALP